MKASAYREQLARGRLQLNGRIMLPRSALEATTTATTSTTEAHVGGLVVGRSGGRGLGPWFWFNVRVVIVSILIIFWRGVAFKKAGRKYLTALSSDKQVLACIVYRLWGLSSLPISTYLYYHLDSIHSLADRERHYQSIHRIH